MEFLNSLTPSGMPPHRLNLKCGSIVMLLRNLSLKDGLCNGTRLIVRVMRPNYIDCVEVTDTLYRESLYIGMPFQLKRTQFPLGLSYALTINKSQGQTFDRIGIYLPKPCFSHGQLYVAFSRARSFEGIKIKISNTFYQGISRRKYYTKNIVYKQML